MKTVGMSIGLLAVSLLLSCGGGPEVKPETAPETRPVEGKQSLPVKLKSLVFFESTAAGAAVEIQPAVKFIRPAVKSISYQLELEADSGTGLFKSGTSLNVQLISPDGSLLSNVTGFIPKPAGGGSARTRTVLCDTAKLKDGRYRVVLYSDGKLLGDGSFTIETFLPVAVASVEFSEGAASGQGDRKKGTTFSRSEARTIFAHVTLKNHLHLKADQSVQLTARWHRGSSDAGSLVKQMIIISGDQPVAGHTFKIGWETAGRWPAGRQFLDLDCPELGRLGSSSFDVTDHVVALPADHPLYDLNVRLFEAGKGENDPEKKRTATLFNKMQVRYIKAAVEAKHRNQGKKASAVRLEVKIFLDRALDGVSSEDAKIPSEWHTVTFYRGLGYDEPGKWDAGVYRIEVWVDQYKVRDLNFEIKDDRPKHQQDADRLLKAAVSRHPWDSEGRIADLTQAIQLHPTIAAHVQRAKARNELDDFEGAMADLSRSLDLDPKAQDVYRERCRILTSRDRKEGALADASKLVELNPSLDHLKLRARTRTRFGEHAAAEEDFTAVIRADSKNPESYVERATLKQKMGRLQDSLIDITIAIDIAPARVDLYAARANLRFQHGDRRSAAADLEKFLELTADKAAAYLSRAQIRKNWDDWEGALADFQRAIDADGNSPAALTARADAKLARGDAGGAIADYTAALARNPKSPYVYENRGKARRDSNDLEGAIADVEKAVALDPMMSYRLGTLVDILVEQGNPARAFAECDRLERAKGASLTHEKRATLLARMGNFNDALKEIDAHRAKAANHRWGRSSGLWERSLIQFQKGDWEAALRDSDDLMRDNPWPHHHRRLVEAYYAVGRLPQALTALREGRGYSYGGQDHENLAWAIRARSGEADVATRELKERTRPQPGQGEAFTHLITDFLVGRIDEEHLLAQAAKLNLSSEKWQLASADFYIGIKRLVLGEKEKGLDRLQKVVRADLGYSWMAIAELSRGGRRPVGPIVLGIQPASEPQGQEGVLVAAVFPGTYADRAGLQKGDLVQEVGSRKVTPGTLYRVTLESAPDPVIVLKVMRNGEALTLEIKP